MDVIQRRLRGLSQELVHRAVETSMTDEQQRITLRTRVEGQ